MGFQQDSFLFYNVNSYLLSFQPLLYFLHAIPYFINASIFWNKYRICITSEMCVVVVVVVVLASSSTYSTAGR